MWVAWGSHGGGLWVPTGWLADGLYMACRSHGGSLRLACISIRNTEKGTLRPLATPVPLWYHPGPTLVP